MCPAPIEGRPPFNQLLWSRVPELRTAIPCDRWIIEDGGGRSRRTSTDRHGHVIKDEVTLHRRSVFLQAPRELGIQTLAELVPLMRSCTLSTIATPDENFSLLDRLDLTRHHRWDIAAPAELSDPAGMELPVVVTIFRPPTSTATEIDWVEAGLYAQLPFGDL